jgi:hydrogenase-4 transcriptional activator
MSVRDVLSDVWREACRHIQIRESVDAIAGILSPHLPLGALIVRRIDPAARTIDTVATAATAGEGATNAVATTVDASAWRRIEKWLREGGVIRGLAAEDDPRLEAVVPDGAHGSVMAGPLRSPVGPIGVMIVTCRGPRGFTTDHVRLAQRLLEPFAVALENDRRLHELESLRDAAEADRESLLKRLGRQTLAEDVVGAQTGLKHVMERVELIAKSDVPVLILGDTGTGKEVVSRAIHARSKQADGPFIRVNCGAIPPELIDSQLFGHEKGSFTGASEQHQGWFERANGGTLFLDEIGELPLPAQVRLLRVLQDHQIERVGGKSPIRVEVRIVAATHRDLAQMVKDRTFREDLWYRVNVFPILLPPLRERIADIPALVGHFANRAAVRFGLPAVEPTQADLRTLSDYPWPGNIRELNAVIDRAVILGKGRRLDVATSLGFGQPIAPSIPPADATMYEVIPESAVPLASRPTTESIIPLDAAMRQHIEKALAATRGRIEGGRGAAAILRINPHTLRARMRKLGIDVDRFRD